MNRYVYGSLDRYAGFFLRFVFERRSSSYFLSRHASQRLSQAGRVVAGELRVGDRLGLARSVGFLSAAERAAGRRAGEPRARARAPPWRRQQVLSPGHSSMPGRRALVRDPLTLSRTHHYFFFLLNLIYFQTLSRFIIYSSNSSRVNSLWKNLSRRFRRFKTKTKKKTQVSFFYLLFCFFKKTCAKHLSDRCHMSLNIFEKN